MEKNNATEGSSNKKIIVLPYINKICESIASTIDKSQFITEYRVLNNLGRFIRAHKDTNTLLSNNNVVYKISCNDCNASWSKRQLKTRIKEHINNSKMTSAKHTVITDHMQKFSHSFDWDSIKILNFEPNFYKRLVFEMLHVKE